MPGSSFSRNYLLNTSANLPWIDVFYSGGTTEGLFEMLSNDEMKVEFFQIQLTNEHPAQFSDVEFRTGQLDEMSREISRDVRERNIVFAKRKGIDVAQTATNQKTESQKSTSDKETSTSISEKLKREFKFTIQNENGRMTGRLLFEKKADDWKGKMWCDQMNAWEELEAIALSETFIKFFHPRTIQSYMGDINNGKVNVTYYRGGQNFKWTAEEQ